MLIHEAKEEEGVVSAAGAEQEGAHILNLYATIKWPKVSGAMAGNQQILPTPQSQSRAHRPYTQTPQLFNLVIFLPRVKLDNHKLLGRGGHLNHRRLILPLGYTKI